MEGAVFLKRFSETTEVDSFIEVATDISNKTYQYKLLGLGIRNLPKVNYLFTKTAQHGWWRGFLLYCKNEPVAFVYGYQVGTTFYYWDSGYDPKWTKWSVGNVATVKLVETLITGDDRTLRLDFLYGDYEYKRRLGNVQCEEQNFYLFPRDWRTFFLSHSFQMTNRLSYQAGQALERYKLKSRIKRIFRRQAIRG
jgi:CelD/BcsL family acetyltransferase involved in cellulose biosynthesis